MSLKAALALVLLCPGLALADSDPDRLPFTFTTRELLPLDRVERAELPRFDPRPLLAAEAARPRTEPGPLLVGQPMEVDLAPDRAGTWETLPTGDRVWRLVIDVPGARWVVLGFGTYRLQAGAALRVFDPAGGTLFGPYTAADVADHGQLFIPPVPGERAVVELFWPRARLGEEPRLHLGIVSHGFRPVPGMATGGASAPDVPFAGACEIDVNCPLGTNWQNDKRGVINLLSGGSGYCSGSLIGNTGNDCKNLVLTAHHCLSSQGSAASTTFQFNFERPLCNAGTAPTNQNVSGSNLRATYSSSDFTLLELSAPIPSAYNPYYNGWTRSTTPATQAWGIHHPNNDEKKISHSPNPLVNGSSWGANHWRVNWTSDGHEGVTEPGSSGSPLFDPQHRIVGQLHGGDSSCTAPPSGMWDEYGKVDVSWAGGGTSGSRLSDWLDPAGTGAIAVDGLDVSTCLNPTAKLVYASSRVLDPLGNGNGVIDPGERFTLVVADKNTGSQPATHVTGALQSDAPQLTFVDNTAAWPDIAMSATAETLAPHFTLQVDPSTACGTALRLHLVNDADEGTWSSDFTLVVGANANASVFQDDMEHGAGTWTTAALTGNLAWQLATNDARSPTHSWLAPETLRKTDMVLVMQPLVNLGAGATMTFAHTFRTESQFDGGVLEYTTNGGANWQDAASLVTSGGYTNSISPLSDSTLSGRAAWSGDSGGWKTVSLDLSSLAGRTVQFRWRYATNSKVAVGPGWNVDDVVVSSTSFDCAPAPPGEATALTIVRAGSSYELAWSAPAYGGATTGYELYRTPPGAPVQPTCESDLGAGTTATLTSLTSNQGFLVVARNAAGDGSYGSDSNGVERAHAASPCP